MSDEPRKKRVALYIKAFCLAALAAVLLVIGYAWVSSNINTSSNDMQTQIVKPGEITIDPTMTAVRTCLSGDVVTDTYNIDDNGSIYLIKRVTVSPTEGTTTETHDVSEKVAFVMSDMLPGEHVDITVGFWLSDDLDGYPYGISFEDMTSGTFTIDDHDHYAAGAFKYKSISLVNSAGTAIADYSGSSFSWVVDYDIAEDDTLAEDIPLLTGTWDKDNEKEYFTFRIQEDFSQYYSLVNKAKSAYPNQLSKKTFNVKSLVFYWEEK